MKSLLALLTSALACLGQPLTTADPAFMAQQFVSSGAPPSWPWGTPTNNTDGTQPMAWYVADDYFTNGAVVTLPDRWTNAWHLTNAAATGTWPTYEGSSVNGHADVQFDGVDDYLKSVSLTNAVGVHHFWMVMDYNATVDPDAISPYFDGVDSSGRMVFMPLATLGRARIYYGLSTALTTVNNVNLGMSNHWTIVEIKFDATQGWLFTNNVNVTLSSGPATAYMNGLTLASRYITGTYHQKYKLAEFISYNYTNNNVQRSNIVCYLTNKYSIPATFP